MSDALYLPDTNILVHLVRYDSTGQHISARYNLLSCTSKPIISAVTHGELRSLALQSLALQFNWGNSKADQASFLLNYFETYPIASNDLFQAYAAIDDFSRRNGTTMGKNDLWIAATSRVTGATLLTTDQDFDHLPASLILRERVPSQAR